MVDDADVVGAEAGVVVLVGVVASQQEAVDLGGCLRVAVEVSEQAVQGH